MHNERLRAIYAVIPKADMDLLEAVGVQSAYMHI